MYTSKQNVAFTYTANQQKCDFVIRSTVVFFGIQHIKYANN